MIFHDLFQDPSEYQNNYLSNIFPSIVIKNVCTCVYVAGHNKIQVKMILTYFDSQFPLSSNPMFMIHE